MQAWPTESNYLVVTFITSTICFVDILCEMQLNVVPMAWHLFNLPVNPSHMGYEYNECKLNTNLDNAMTLDATKFCK